MTENNTDYLESMYIRNLEYARLDRAQNGDYTKAGLKSLIEAAKIQFQLYRMTSGAESRQHHEAVRSILTEAYNSAKKQGIILPPVIPKEAMPDAPQPQAPAAPAPTAAAQQPSRPAQEDDEDPEEKLQGLIGLTEAKEALKTLISTLTANKLREENGLPLLNVPKHMVFTGNPGTGKTTVARLVSRIMQKKGLLSKGHLVEVNANELIKGYVGHSSEATRKAGEEAAGGVLFIDEAYAITKSKYVDEIVPTLLSVMENNQKDLSVIVAGYTDEMREFIDSNPGFKSRFNHWIHFPDYSADEMLKIFRSMCESKKQKMGPGTEELLRSVFEEKRLDKDFGNARGVRNMFDHANMNLSRRIDTLPPGAVNKDVLTTITAEDIRKAAEEKNGV